MGEISTIVFDLGGVLIELDGPPIKDTWLNENLDYAENWRRWGGSRYVKAYETGVISSNEFITGVISELKLNVSDEAFRSAYISWPKAFFPGTEKLLARLKTKYRLAFYSNTSELHLPRLLEEIGLATYFERTFASYDIGYFKPDHDGYRHVLSEMNVFPEEVLFIDDNQMNVEGAEAVGMRARKAFQHDEVKRVLREEGCLLD